MKLTKRLLAMLLTVVMVLTMLPAIALTASAVDTGTVFNLVTSLSDITDGDYIILGKLQTGTNANKQYLMKDAGSTSANVSGDLYQTASSVPSSITYDGSTVAANKIWHFDYQESGTNQGKVSIQGSSGNYFKNNGSSNGSRMNASLSQYMTFAASGNFSDAFTMNTSGSGRTYFNFNYNNGSVIFGFYTAQNNSSTMQAAFYLYKASTTPVTTTYAVTYSQPASGGTFTVTSGGTTVTSGTEVNENSSLTLTATPASNAYVFSGWTVTGSTGPSPATTNPATITVTAATTISATFTARTVASITLSRNGTTETPSGTYYVGDSYTLPGAGADVNGHKHVGWSSVTIPTPGSEPTSNYYAPGASVTLAASQTYYAVYAQQSGTAEVTTWNLVTAAPSDWNGEYVIANNASSSASVLIADGSVTGTAYSSATAVKTLSAAGMTYDSTTQTLSGVTDAYTFVVSDAATSGKHYIKMKGASSDLYLIGNSTTGSSSLSTATSTGTTAEWSISYGTSSPYLVGNAGRYMGWNASYFRAYASSNKDTYTLQLFKKSTSAGGASYTNYTTSPVAPSVDTYSVTITQPSNGSISTNDTLIDLEAGDTVTLTANPNTGYEINAWTISGATHTESGNSTTITIGSSDVTATVSFRKVDYTITKNAGANGSITAASTANYQDAVSFTVTPSSGYQIATVTVTQTSGGAAVAFTDNGSGSYTITSMPAANVTIAATFALIPTYDYTFYGPNNSTVATGNAASVNAPAGSPASITYTYPGETTPTTFTFAGWVAGQAQLTTPGAASGEIIPAGTPITLSANTTYRAVYAPSGSGGNGFKLSLESGGTTYYVGPRSSNNSYLDYPTDAADAAEFVLEEDPNNAGHYFMYYLSGANKIYIYNSSTQAGSDTGMEFTTNTAPSGSGYIYWVESISNGVATYQNVNSSGTGTRYLAFNSNRFSTYGTSYAYEFTKTGGAAYLTEPGANYFAVTYNENAGGDTVTNMPENGAVQENTSYTIPNTIPVRDGYRFDGWATSASGSVAYAAGSLPATISNVSAAIDLYAKWSVVPQATVTFYEADNTTTFDTASVYEGVAPTAPATDPTKAPSGIYYYTFAGWSRTAGGSVESPMTVIASGESTRAYYPVFTQNAAAFTLNLSGRIKVSTEGSFQSTVLTPSLTTEQTGCSATLTSLSATYTSGSASIATFTTTGNVLTVTGVAAGSVTLNVTATYDDGHTATKSVTITVIAGNGGTAGGYKLITQENTFTTDSGDVNNYDWSGEYLMVARPNGTAANFNTLEVMQFVWTDDTTATIADSNQNRAEFDLGSATQDDFGVATAANGSVTIHAIHTGEGDYVSGATTTEGGMIYDRITGFTDGSDNDITNKYVLVFERVDDVNNYYTIRVKGTNYYLTNSSTALTGGNTMGGNASPESIGSQLMWHLRWAGSDDTIDGRASNTITLNGESFTPDSILIESVEALNSNVSRAILYNQAGHMFRVYGEGAYVNNGPLIGINGGYNLFLYGKQIPFESEIIYDDVERNTTNAKIEVPYNYTTMTSSDTLLLEGLLDPESYPGWTILNSGIPTWTLVGAYNSDNSSFTPSASVTAVSGTQNAEFHVANWSASDIGKYYVVKINYQVQDPDGVTHDVPQQAMIVVTDADLTFNTIINESSSMDHTGSYTVPSRDGTSGVDLNAYIVDNYGIQYSQRSIPDGFELTQPSSWSYTSQRGYTYAIDSAGVITWTPGNILKDDVVVITATAGLTENGVAQTVTAGTFTLYVNKLAYTAEVQDASDSTNTTIPYAASAFAVTLGNYANNNGDAPGSATYSINSATEWNWTAVKEADGTAVPITRTSTGATINVTGLDAGTRIVVRATNVIATSNTTSGVHTVVTVAGKVFTVGEDTRMTAVNDSFVLDFDRDAKLNVLANDRYADGATLTLGAAPTGVTLTKNSDNTVTFGVPGGQLTTATYTFTYTLSKSGETDSTATVTVKPSSAIYYEDTNDDFFTYSNGTRGRWSEVGADNAWLQDASAATDGYDAANNSLTWSAGIAHKANVGKDTSYGDSSASGTWPKVEFTFVGNAFSISMMRNNYTGLVAVYVDGTKVKNLPTAYGATGGGYDPEADYGGFIYESSDSNYGMPAFYWAAENGTAGTHSVKVEVLYSSMYDHNSPKSNYDVYIDGVTIYNPISGTTAYKYISFRDTVLATGSLGVPATQPHDYAATLTPASISIGTGHTGSLHLSLTDAGATVYTGYTVVYSSSDTSVATVTTNGSLNTTTGVNTATVTGVGEGTATITATITTPGGTTLTRTATVTVTDTVYTVTYILPNGEQEVSYANSTIQLGTGVTHLTAAELAAYDAHNYSFRGWLNTALPSDTDTMPGALRDDGATVTLTGDATYYAVYRYGTTDTDFVLKTDLTTPLVNGDTILIYETEGTGDKYVLSNQNYGSSGWQLNYRSGDAAIPSHNMITKSNTELYWDVVATTGGFYLKDKDGNYLSATDTDGQLVVLTSPDSAKSVWNATTTGVNGENSVFIYTNQSTPQYLQHYSGYPEFCCYTWDEAYSNKNEMQIYVQAELANYYATTLGIATPSYTVTYKVNGTTVDTEAVREGNDPSFTAPAASTYSSYDAHDYTFLGWIPSTISPDSTEAPATIYEAGDPYAVSANLTFHAVFSYTGAGSGSGFTLSYTNSGTTYYLGTDNGSGGVAVSTDSSNAATYGLEQIGTSEYYYLYYLNGSNKIYLTGNTGSSSSTRTVTFSDANTQPSSGYYKWYIDSNNKFVCNNGSSDGGALQINTNDKTYAKMYTSAQWGAFTQTAASGVSATYYATTLNAATPVTHDYAASITPSSLALHTGETGSVSATLTDDGVTVTGATPTYTTSDASVATVAADGTVTAVANGNATITATYTVGGNDYTATCAVTVTTLATYTVTYMVNGSQYGETESVTQGDSPSFTAPSYDVSGYNAHAYEFLGWKEGSALSGDTTEAQTLYVAGNTHTISANTTYYAVYRYTEGGGALTEAIDLSNGASGQYVIAANVGGTYYAMHNSSFSGKLDRTQIATPGSSISSSDATNYVVTIAKTSDGFTISNGTNLLGYPSSGTDFTTDTHPYWSITTGTHGSYRVANTNTTNRAITYRAGSTNKFAPYATSNINGTEYYDVEIIPVGDSSSATYYATTLNVAAAHNYVASISPTSVTIEAGQETTAIGTLTDNGITTTAYTPTYTSSNTGVATVSSIGYVEAISAGSATITVSYSVDGTTYSATCAVTVTAATVVTSYTVSYYVNGSLFETETVAENGHPDFDAPTTDISAYDAQDYSFAGWAANTVSDTTTAPTMYTASTASSYTVTGDVTFHAVYTWSEGGSGSGSGTASYTKVTSTSDLADGKYLIVCENVSMAMTDAVDGTSNGTSVTIDNGTIASSSAVDALQFTLTKSNGALQGPNGKYIGNASNSNSLTASETALTNTITFSSGDANIVSSGGAYLRYNKTSGQERFRYYKSSSYANQQAIQLYKYVTSGGSGSGSSTSYYTTTLAAGDGETATLSVSPSSMSLLTGGYGQIAVTAANGGANAYVTATSSSNSVAQVYALNDGNNTFGVTAGSAGSATVTIRYFDSSNTQLASQTVSVTVTAASGTGGTNADYGRVGSDGNAPTTSGSTNAGTRGVVATSISQKAADYYTAKGVTWADLTALSGVYTNSSVTAASGNALKSQLDSLMNLTNTVTYSSLTTYWPNTDKSNGSSQNLYIYSNVTSNSSVSREHVWPKSRGQFYESGAGSDLQHLRPEESTVNSTRGNHTMGYVNGVLNNPSTKTYGGNTVLWYNGSYSSNDCSGLVEVMDCCKGDVARILLYVYTAYPENTNLFTKTSGGGSGNNASDGNKVIESLNTLLEWCALDPVDTWEMSRNDAVQTIQGNRNVYIDYPELAWMIFNLTPPTTMQTPSGQAAAGNVGTRNSANYYTSAVNNTAIMSEDPAPETRGGATRTVGGENSDLPVTGAVMLNGIGQISNNDDVMSYLASYGAQNCLVIPASGSVVFYLTGGSAESQIAIGASALNGTGTTLKVYQISAVSGSSATGTILVEQSLVSSTEMYFAINGIAWTGEKSNVLMVRNEGSAPMVLTNLRAVTGTVEGHISTGGTESVGSQSRGHARSTDNELEMVIDANAILAGIAGVQSINEGTFDETPVDPIDPIDPVESDIVLRGNSISLNGQIDVNFYVDVPADLMASGVYATLDGVRADFVEGTYGTMVSKKLPAKEMNTKVTLRLYAADGTPLSFLSSGATVTSHSYSVQDYLTYVIGNPATYGDELVKLCKAMSDYGSYTQHALGFDVENAKSAYLADEIAALTCEGYGYDFTANTANITFLGASVVTESETAIRVYFALTGEGFTATVDGEPAAIQTNERGTFVELANISAKNLGDAHTFVITNGSETVTVSNYSAYSYVQSVLSYAGASDSLVLAAKALKLYGDLAAAYFNK